MARGSTPGIRLSFAPLEAALIRNGFLGVDEEDHAEEDEKRLPSRLRAAIWKARMNGYFTLAMADEIACTVLKMHPLNVWGAEYETKVWHDSESEELVA